MEAFPSAKHLCSWAGLTPINNESADKKNSVPVFNVNSPKQKPVMLNSTNTLQFLKDYGAEDGLLLRLEQQLAASNL